MEDKEKDTKKPKKIPRKPPASGNPGNEIRDTTPKIKA
jgi:hypothetical protein